MFAEKCELGKAQQPWQREAELEAAFLWNAFCSTLISQFQNGVSSPSPLYTLCVSVSCAL